MMQDPEREDTGGRVDSKIDNLLANLASLSDLVDRATETLTRTDAAAVRRAFQAKEEKGQDG